MPSAETQVRRDSRLFRDLSEAVLREGHAVQFEVQGESMRPNLLDGDVVMVSPASLSELNPGDVAFTENPDRLLVHRVTGIDVSSGAVATRGDAGLESDTPSTKVYGRVSTRQRREAREPFDTLRARMLHPLRTFARRLRLAAVRRLRLAASLILGVVASLFLGAVFVVPTAHAQTADLQLVQTASASAVAAGANYNYTEVVTNNSSSATVTSGTITVYMQTPANTNFRSYAGTNWTCTAPGVGGVGPIVCTYNTTLASAATASTLTLTVQVAVWAASSAYAVGTRIVDSNGNIEQVVSIAGTGTSGTTAPTWNTTLGGQTTDHAGANQIVWQNGGTAAGTSIQGSATVTNSTFADTAPANNTSLTSIVVEPVASSDLALSISVSPTPVFIFSTLTYNIQIQNLGQASAPVTANVLTDALPASVGYVSYAASAGWSCPTVPAVGSSGTVSCSITSAMALGSAATITITVTAPSTASTLSNTASVSLAGDPNSANNSATAYTVVQPLVCATPGRDGAGGSLSGVVNTYFPPTTAGTLAAGSTSVALGTASGAAKAVAAGDLLLIIQMQGAGINSTNTSSYGHGVPGDPASGSTSLGSSGLFEFVTATNAVPTAGGTLTFTGTGPTGGLLNSYSFVAASSSGSTYVAQQTYQVIRVPQYTSATLASGLLPLAWTGSVGGVLALDVSSQLILGGTVALDALGFRGAGGQLLTGPSVGGTNTPTDYVTGAPASATTTTGANGSKGEGIAGTPRYVAPATIATTTTPTDAYLGALTDSLPGGSYARGAPGNAGGGGTDGHPVNNDYNSGGGAGGNGGAGGQGGYGWNSMAATNSTDGGFGGTAFPASTSALVMGGGGGAGTTNNGSYYISGTNHNANCGANCTGIYSSGGAGGGIAIIHAGSVTGTGAITSNGGSTLSTDNDSTGGGGAGGSILVFANSGGLTGLTLSANGGTGGDAWPETAPGGFPGQRHGPGGGGGGGVIFLTATPTSSSVTGAANGYTDSVQDSYGATPGQSGLVVTTHVITETPGTQSGAYCAGADLAVTNAGSPTIVAPGGTLTYTQSVTNNGPFDAVNVVFNETVPTNTTFQSITFPAGWTCPMVPAPGGTGNISCNNLNLAKGASGTFTVIVTVNVATSSGTQIVDVDNVTSGTTDPNLSNNSATAVNSVGASSTSDLSVTNTASAPTVTAGSNFTMTAVVTNNGPAAATTVVFSEPTASNSAGTSNATFVSLAPPSGWSCSTPSPAATGTITCSTASLGVGGSATFAIVMNVPTGTAPGTVLLGNANIVSATPDPNAANNAATASIVVAAAGQADLAMTSSGSPNPVINGGNITYAQSATNNGPTSITANGTTTTVTFTDTIPLNTTLAAVFVAPANWNCNSIPVGGTSTITCTLVSGQTFASGASVNFPLVVKVNAATAPGTIIVNSPNITSTVGDPNTANNTASVNTTVASPTQAFVSITKTASPEPVDQGTNLTYTIVVKNAGPAIAQGVNVSDPIPSQVTYVSASASQGSCSNPSGTVNCSLGNLSVGSATVITINVTASTFGSSAVPCNGTTTYFTACNTATVSTTGTSNPNPTTSSSVGSTIVAPNAVDISSFRAFSQTDGSVELMWRTHEESRNLGFHIYREDASGRHRINPSLIAGSALLLRGTKPQHAAKVYRWIDSQPTAGASYSIEDVDINGTRTLHGPAYAEVSSASQIAAQASVHNARGQEVSPTLRELRPPMLRTNAAARVPKRPRPVLPVPPLDRPPLQVADRAAVQIYVDHEGWYHIPFAQLFAAGLDPASDVRSLHLFAEGVEQPLLLAGGSVGMASPTDALEFYGTGIDTPFSGTRVYWLVRDNSHAKRIVAEQPTVSAAAAPPSFPFTVVREDRTIYFAALLNGENNDNFFGAVVSSDPVDQPLVIAHRDTSSSLPVSLDLSIQGVTDGQQHTVSVDLNGRSLGNINFFGEILFEQTFPADPSFLVDGTNTVTLTALNGDNDVSVVQSIRLHYPHTYTADGDWLSATVPARTETRISGFANPRIRAFDISDPLNISELPGKISLDSGSYGINLVVPGGLPFERTVLAFSDDALSSPASLVDYRPTFLDDKHAGADIVIITHPDFVANLQPLVTFRASEGHAVSVVTTDAIYDEYNYGERSPFAIRRFLFDAASNWRRKPQAVLLVGDASFDPRDYLGFGETDFVPTRIIETAAFKTASDDWFTDFRQTGFATIPTGRLPVRTPADTDLVVSKIVGYERGDSGGPWTSQALFIADQNVDSNFSAAAVSAAGTMPSSLEASTLLTDGLDAATAHDQIIAALNAGALLVNYDGHGAEQQWSFADLLSTDDAAALTNGGRLPVYLLMDCLNGFFQDVYAQSLAESLILAPAGGGVAVWASSGFTSQPPQASMNLALLHQFAAHPTEPLGSLILQAKAGTTDNDVRRTWILFGDPAMRIHFPTSSPAATHNSAVRTILRRDLNGPSPRDANRKREMQLP
jgi:uncharacterized repeat protein (TIGR01451 family)